MTSALAGIPGALAMTLLLATSAVSQDVELDPNRAVETQSQTPDATQADTADQTDAEAAAQAAAAADAAAPATGQQTTTTAARRSALAGILVRDVVFPTPRPTFPPKSWNASKPGWSGGDILQPGSV